MAVLAEVVEEDPTNFISHWNLGVLKRPNDREAALEHFENGLSEMDVPLGHASRSVTLRMLGRAEEALGLDIKVFERMTELLVSFIGEQGQAEVREWFEGIRNDKGAIFQLTPESMDIFNAAVEIVRPDVESIVSTYQLCSHTDLVASTAY